MRGGANEGAAPAGVAANGAGVPGIAGVFGMTGGMPAGGAMGVAGVICGGVQLSVAGWKTRADGMAITHATTHAATKAVTAHNARIFSRDCVLCRGSSRLATRRRQVAHLLETLCSVFPSGERPPPQVGQKLG